MKNDADSRLFGFYHTTIIIVKLDRAQRLEYFYEEQQLQIFVVRVASCIARLQKNITMAAI